MNEELIKLGYDYRFVRVMTDEDKLFFIKNHNIISNIKERLRKEFEVPEDKLLKVIQMCHKLPSDIKLYDIENEFFKKVNYIIKSEIRNHRLSLVLSETIINFSKFKELF